MLPQYHSSVLWAAVVSVTDEDDDVDADDDDAVDTGAVGWVDGDDCCVVETAKVEAVAEVDGWGQALVEQWDCGVAETKKQTGKLNDTLAKDS